MKQYQKVFEDGATAIAEARKKKNNFTANTIQSKLNSLQKAINAEDEKAADLIIEELRVFQGDKNKKTATAAEPAIPKKDTAK